MVARSGTGDGSRDPNWRGTGMGPDSLKRGKFPLAVLTAVGLGFVVGECTEAEPISTFYETAKELAAHTVEEPLDIAGRLTIVYDSFLPEYARSSNDGASSDILGHLNIESPLRAGDYIAGQRMRGATLFSATD